MAYFVENEDGTFSLKPSPNVKVFMKLENPEKTYSLFEQSVEQVNKKTSEIIDIEKNQEN